jgi:hypothetical protein
VPEVVARLDALVPPGRSTPAARATATPQPRESHVGR